MEKIFFLTIIISGFFSCSDDFKPRSYLERLEILSLKQEGPLYLNESSLLKITPLVFTKEGDSLKESQWTFCLAQTDSRSEYACPVASCELEITGAQINLVLEDNIIPSCLTSLKARGLTQTPLTILYTAKSTQGEERKSLLELPLHLDKSTTFPLTAPSITEVKIKDQIITEDSSSTVTPLSLKEKVSITVKLTRGKGFSEDGKNLEEKEPLLYFYSTVGKFKAATLVPKKGSDTVEAEWILEDYGLTKKEAELYIVIRDESGGQASWVKKKIALKAS